MGVIFTAIMIISYIFAFFNGTTAEVTAAVFDGARSGVDTVLSFAGVMCFWTAVMKAAQSGGAIRFFEAALYPVIKLLFPRLKNEKAKKYITLNMSANLLGLGNAATPMGIEALRSLCADGREPVRDICVFTVLNTSAFQLVPTTILALRSGAGASDPFCIILPIWCASLCALFTGILLAKLIPGAGKIWNT